jgi:hypothetical protein
MPLTREINKNVENMRQIYKAAPNGKKKKRQRCPAAKSISAARAWRLVKKDAPLTD